MTEECEKCGKSFDSEEALEQHMEDYDHSENEEEQQNMKDLLMESNLFGVSLIAVLILGSGFMFVSAVSDTANQSSNSGSTLIDTDGEPYIGSSNANTTIAYFGDYNCSACLYFEQNTFNSLQEQVIGEDVKFVKKNFAVINSQSPRLAQASQSVWEQTKDSNPEAFWEWHAKMYDNQGGYGTNWATTDTIIGLTEEINGVDAEKVRDDLESGEYRSETRGDQTEGQSSGVRGTPTFIIFNSETGKSEQLVGPQPVSRFENAVSSVSS